MGYLLSSVGNLPIDENVSLYIFVVNGSWRGEPYEMLEKNFSNIAQQIGENAVIAKGFEPKAWTSQIAKAYFGKDSNDLFSALPALLINDAHPDNIAEDSMRLIVPLREVEGRFLDWDNFFQLLSDFALNKNPDFLEKFKEKKKAVDVANRIIDLKPNFFGIGLNINAIIEKFR